MSKTSLIVDGIPESGRQTKWKCFNMLLKQLLPGQHIRMENIDASTSYGMTNSLRNYAWRHYNRRVSTSILREKDDTRTILVWWREEEENG